MKIYFHPDFLKHYAFDPAAEPGRLEPALAVLERKYPIHEPQPAVEDDILLVHTPRHWRSIAKDQILHHTALLAAGASKAAAETATGGEHAFALCRPPGHHASSDSCWGFCYYNNIAVTVSSLLDRKMIDSALIVDFDLHFGDGTANIFKRNDAVFFWHSHESASTLFLEALENDLDKYNPDIIAVSAGFDRGIDDWGGMLDIKDYHRIGALLARSARQKCGNRLFAVLEGGYNPRALAVNIEAFLQGLEAE